MIVAYACIRTSIMYKCSKFGGICPECTRNVKSQQRIIAQAFSHIRATMFHVKTNVKHLLLSGLPKPSAWKRLQHCSTIVILKFMDVFKCFKCEKTTGKDNVLVNALGYPVCFSYCLTVIHDNFELILWYIMPIRLDLLESSMFLVIASAVDDCDMACNFCMFWMRISLQCLDHFFETCMKLTISQDQGYSILRSKHDQRTTGGAFFIQRHYYIHWKISFEQIGIHFEGRNHFFIVNEWPFTKNGPIHTMCTMPNNKSSWDWVNVKIKFK